jgi:uncharacterized RDD family membrane protein YckC
MSSMNDRSYELADVGTRLIALIIDNIILGVLGGIFFGATRQGWGGGIFTFGLGLLYYWYCWTRRDGQTIGNSLMKIRVIKNNGTPLQDADAIIRYMGYYINSIFFGLGWLWALFDEKKRGWHDMLANTYVVVADDDKQKRKNDFNF